MPARQEYRIGAPSPAAGGGPVFCVVARIFDAELPYVGSFIRHYAGMGVQRMFFVNTFQAHFQEVCGYIARHAVGGVELVVINTKRDKGQVNRMQDQALHAGMGDYVINVDVDEYWVLPPSIPDLATLVRRRPADVYQFFWLMVPFDGAAGVPRPPYSAFHGTNGKYMARPSNLRRLGVHRPYLKGGGGRPVRYATCGSLVHFWGRGFKDCLLKAIGQKIGNAKTSTKEELLELASEGDIPNRLKLLAYFCRQPRGLALRGSPRRTLLEIDTAKEDELLWKKISRDEFDRVRSLYLSFARRLRAPGVWRALPDYGSGISDLSAVDALSPIRATPQRAPASVPEASKRSGGRRAGERPAKFRRASSDSEASTAVGADVPPSPSESASADDDVRAPLGASAR